MKKNLGKEIKDVGVLIIVIGAIMIGLVFYVLFSSGGNESSVMFTFLEERFPFLIIFGLVFLLVGIIVRSVGKSKEVKQSSQNDK